MAKRTLELGKIPLQLGGAVLKLGGEIRGENGLIVEGFIDGITLVTIDFLQSIFHQRLQVFQNLRLAWPPRVNALTGMTVLENGTELTGPGVSAPQGVLVGKNPTYPDLDSDLWDQFISGTYEGFSLGRVLKPKNKKIKIKDLEGWQDKKLIIFDKFYISIWTTILVNIWETRSDNYLTMYFINKLQLNLSCQTLWINCATSFFFDFSRVIISGLYFDIKIRWKRMEKVTEASNDEFWLYALWMPYWMLYWLLWNLLIKYLCTCIVNLNLKQDKD